MMIKEVIRTHQISILDEVLMGRVAACPTSRHAQHRIQLLPVKHICDPNLEGRR